MALTEEERKAKNRKIRADREEDRKNYFEIEKFENLLSRLEASKLRQARSTAVDERKGTWASGLASMMSNF